MRIDASFLIGEEVSVMVRINVSICPPVSFAWPVKEPMIKVAIGERWGKMSLNNVVMFPQVQGGAGI